MLYSNIQFAESRYAKSFIVFELSAFVCKSPSIFQNDLKVCNRSGNKMTSTDNVSTEIESRQSVSQSCKKMGPHKATSVIMFH